MITGRAEMVPRALTSLGRDGGLTDERARAALAAFFAKARMGWKETVTDQRPNMDGKPFIFRVCPADAKR